MKYLCLVYLEENKIAAMPQCGPDAIADDECMAYSETLRERGCR
jgi:hypothetical protein